MPFFIVAATLICDSKYRAVLLILTNADAGTKPTIIVIDDDAPIRKALGKLLGSDGWSVSSYASAEDFLQASSPDGIRCLVLDIDLPGMSGLHLQQRLAFSDDWRHVPVIFVTARYDHEGRTKAQAIHNGAYAFLLKPFIGENLLHAVRSATQTVR
jgi:FixJ family two-component response regulator